MSIGKMLISFCLGAIAGGAASAIYFRKKYEKDLALEAEEIRKQIESSNIFDEYKDVINKETETDITATNIITPNNEANTMEDNNANKETPEEDEPLEPFVITEEEYSNEKFNYDKESLTFWVDDETLTENAVFNDNPEMVDVDSTIGDEMFNTLLESDADEMFVRCPNTSTDYEIIKKYDSYKDVIGM